MKKVLLILLVIFLGGFIKTQGQNSSANIYETKHIKKESKLGEKIFIKHAASCLVLIEEAAQNISIKGVAIIAFIPGDTALAWISKMKVVGALTGRNANFLAIAYSKASEMASTFKNSGSGIRDPMKGEFGFRGGVIKKVDAGYILAAFSGGTPEQDLVAANKGLDGLSKYYAVSSDK
jgi:hypothetical protein